MIERSITFGADDGLVGTICTPSGQSAVRRDVGLILFNAGVIHRIGPHRLNVRIARRLADRGIPSIRFDLAGLGDSSRPSGRQAFEAQAVIDLRSAMDALDSATRIHRFALFGFCSGAYHGYATALADERVAGLLMYDAYRFSTIKARLNRYMMRIQQHGWIRAVGGWAARGLSSFVRGILRAILARKEGRRVADVGFITEMPSKIEFAAGLRTLLDRGVKIGLVYSGGGFEVYNYDGQFRDAFYGLGITDRVTAEFLPDLDHVATSMAAQAELVRQIEIWVLQMDETPVVATKPSNSAG